MPRRGRGRASRSGSSVRASCAGVGRAEGSAARHESTASASAGGMRRVLGERGGRRLDLGVAHAPPPRSGEGGPRRQGLVEGDAEPPDVGGRADLAEALGYALLRRHVRVGADRARDGGDVLDAARHAQVDEPRRAGHDDVARLHVEVQSPADRHVVQGRAHLQGEREQPLGLDPVAADEAGQPRAVEELEHDMGPRAVGDRAERPHDHRVAEALQHLDLAAQAPQRRLVVNAVRAHDLRDHERVEVVVPCEVGLVAAAPAQRAHGPPARGDLVALAEPPARAPPW